MIKSTVGVFWKVMRYDYVGNVLIVREDVLKYSSVKCWITTVRANLAKS